MVSHLVCFATTHYRANQETLCSSARKFGIDLIHKFTFDDLEKSAFYKENFEIFRHKTGFGFFAWKPYFILQVLNAAKDGDLIFYLDCGVEVVADLNPLKALASASNSPVLFQVHGCLNRYFTNRECLREMGLEEGGYWDFEQVNAAFCVFKKDTESVAFVSEWLRHCENIRCVSDIPGVLSPDNPPGFIEHRRDQSILSLLAARGGIEIFRDPSQFGNFRKDERFRQAGELTLAVPYYNYNVVCKGLYSDMPYGNSQYGTLFDHHRRRSAFAQRWPACHQLLVKTRHRALGAIKRLLTPLSDARFKSIENHRLSANMSVAAARLPSVHAANLTVLKSVANWIDASAMSNSFFRYGVPEYIERVINESMGPEPTYTDVLQVLGGLLQKKVQYLEIGVSVGKNFFQMINHWEGSALTGFDIEDINPSLERTLSGKEVLEEWSTQNGSLRKRSSSLTRYAFEGNQNSVHYLCGDVFDRNTWRRLAGSKFNMIFSDAFHSVGAVEFEWNLIQRMSLIDEEEFVLAWDDLGGDMTFLFDRIWRAMSSNPQTSNNIKRLMLNVRGWVGVNERYHRVGVIYKLKN